MSSVFTCVQSAGLNTPSVPYDMIVRGHTCLSEVATPPLNNNGYQVQLYVRGLGGHDVVYCICGFTSSLQDTAQVYLNHTQQLIKANLIANELMQRCPSSGSRSYRSCSSSREGIAAQREQNLEREDTNSEGAFCGTHQ